MRGFGSHLKGGVESWRMGFMETTVELPNSGPNLEPPKRKAGNPNAATANPSGLPKVLEVRSEPDLDVMRWVQQRQAFDDVTPQQKAYRTWFKKKPESFMTWYMRLEEREYRKGRLERPTGGAEALATAADEGTERLEGLTCRLLGEDEHVETVVT